MCTYDHIWFFCGFWRFKLLSITSLAYCVRTLNNWTLCIEIHGPPHSHHVWGQRNRLARNCNHQIRPLTCHQSWSWLFNAQVPTWSSSSKQPQSSKTESFSTHRSLSRWAFTAALFIFVREEKQPRCIPYLSCLCDKISWSKKQKRKGLFWLLVWGVVHHDVEGTWEAWGWGLYCVCHREAKWQC